MTKKIEKINCITELPASYRVRVFYRDHGLEKCYSKTFKYAKYESKEKALAAAIEDRDRVRKELQSTSAKVWTVSELYEESKKYLLISSATQERHQHFYDYAIGEKYGSREIHTITTMDVQECLNVLQDEKSDDYIKRVLSIWKRIYKTATILELGLEDKTLAIVVPKSKKPAPAKRKPLTEETLKQVLDTLMPDPYRDDKRYQFERMQLVCLVWLLYLTGMRPAEALALTSEDWTTTGEDTGEISVSKSVGSTKTKAVTIVPTKTPASIRTIYASGMAFRVMLYLEKHRLCKENPHHYLFTRFDGSLWDINYISDLIYQLCKKKGISFKLYDLRHDFATRMLQKYNPATVRDMMGHTHFNMSIQYARTPEDEIRKAMGEDDVLQYRTEFFTLTPDQHKAICDKKKDESDS